MSKLRKEWDSKTWLGLTLDPHAVAIASPDFHVVHLPWHQEPGGGTYFWTCVQWCFMGLLEE